MYNLISTTKPNAKKEYDCIWCSEKILKGEQHVKEVGEYQGDFQSNRWHQECHNAAQLYFEESNENEFTPHNNERGSKKEKILDVKPVYINKMIDRLTKIVSFEMNPNESKRYFNLVDRHRAVCNAYSFKILFSPNGIGTGVQIICGTCDVKWDITDYDSW